jgi:ABC-2 type transport system permease protein
MTDTTAGLEPLALISASRQPHALVIWLRHAIRRHYRGVLFWTLGVTIYVASIVLIFPSFRDSGAIDMSQYPESIREAFNIQSMNTIESFLSAEVFNYMPLVLMFIPITIFGGAIAGAEERGALDLLFGNPLPRPIFVIAYWLAVALMMLTLLVVMGLGGWIAALLIDAGLSFGESMRAALNVFPITMAAGGLALLLSATVRQKAVAVGVPAALMFLMYLVDIIGKISTTYAGLRDVSFFKAYGDALQEGTPWTGAALLLAIGLALSALAIPAFNRRDIYT